LVKRKYLKHVVSHAIESGILIDFFLFNDRSFRLAPPLIITREQIKEGCGILLKALDYANAKYS
jgi:4-aminobutyrate aminotransferase-like enzyme